MCVCVLLSELQSVHMVYRSWHGTVQKKTFLFQTIYAYIYTHEKDKRSIIGVCVLVCNSKQSKSGQLRTIYYCRNGNLVYIYTYLNQHKQMKEKNKNQTFLRK